jgi:glycosyltransferase involved in cell wall biosynthesis
MKPTQARRRRKRATVSVLVANFNYARFLRDSIGSVLGQSFEDWEMVFVDDGSTDDSIAIVEEYAKQDGRIRVYANRRNRGCGYTKRRCMSLSCGEICCFLDSDDRIDPGALAIMVREHEWNPAAAMIYSDYFICNRDLRIICKNEYHQPGSAMFLMTGIGVNQFATFKRRNYKKTSGIDATFMMTEDRDLYLKLEETGPVVHVPEPLYFYRIHEKSISTMEKSRRAEYWAWQARFAACDRRGLSKEAVFDEVLKVREEVLGAGSIKGTLEYRLGSALFALPRLVKKALRFSSQH